MNQKVQENDRGSIAYKSELMRKGIHLCSLSIPVIYYHISKETALWILVPLMIISIFVEYSRYYIPSVSKIFYSVFGFMLREHEKDEKSKKLNGATFVFVSAVIMVAFFPKIFAVAAFAVLILSDIAAALIGRRFGKHKFLSKSLEGTLSFFVVGCIVMLFTPKITGAPAEYLIAFAAVFVGAIAENISYGYFDDNLSVPVSIGGTMWILYSIFLPQYSLVLLNVPQ